MPILSLNQSTMMTESIGVGGVRSQGNSTSSPSSAHTNLTKPKINKHSQ